MFKFFFVAVLKRLNTSLAELWRICSFQFNDDDMYPEGCTVIKVLEYARLEDALLRIPMNLTIAAQVPVKQLFLPRGLGLRQFELKRAHMAYRIVKKHLEAALEMCVFPNKIACKSALDRRIGELQSKVNNWLPRIHPFNNNFPATFSTFGATWFPVTCDSPADMGATRQSAFGLCLPDLTLSWLNGDVVFFWELKF